MNGRQPVQMVIIDDSVRFAFHVWRYLGRSIGVGSGIWSAAQGEMQDQQLASHFFEEDGGSRPLPTTDGRFAVWWVPGTSGQLLEETFAAVRERIAGAERRFFLIDKRGQPAGFDRGKGRKGNHLGTDGERLGLLALGLMNRDFPEDLKARKFMIVSSYETGTVPFSIGGSLEPFRIWPKSPNTLARIERKAYPRKGASPRRQQTSALHILVTGAGFEIRSDDTGSFGLPGTSDLLVEMAEPFGNDGLEFAPWTEEERKKKLLPRLTHCSQGFEDLDAWWNWLLEEKTRTCVTELQGAEIRERQKLEASACEREMREAFRRVILKYDWGQMNQSLDAAGLDWHAWLTTNYTRFADRAIALRDAYRDRKKGGKNGDPERRWQIVSTSIEARSLTREVLHRGHQTAEAEERKARHLFKLHGDIAHLQTMAIAGYDKELFNSLSFPMDSLHEVYSAAEVFLTQSLRSRREAPPLVWHLVGHGMNDWLLVQLINKVCRQAESSSTWFVLVSRKPHETAPKVIEKLAGGESDRVIPYSARAEEYLARIVSTGGLPEIRSSRSLRRWLAGLRGGADIQTGRSVA